MNLKRLVVFAVAFLMVVTGSLFAQTTGNLSGNVATDGVPLPGVTVTITSPNLQGTRTTVTDVNGNYNIGALPPGDYTVVFELGGMRTVTRNVSVNVASSARADASMQLASLAEAMTVTATAPAVLETTEIQTNINSDLVEELPMGRTITATVNLAPGVSSSGPGGNTMISGGPSYDSTYYINGTVANENLRGQPQNLFIEDAIQETTVMTGGISAEFGRFTGGVVNTITKSGGNRFEGSFRDSFSNPEWREKYEIEDEVPEGELNEVYEATLGGFVVRDRLWFFGAGRYFEVENNRFFARSTRTFQQTNEETRLEGKLTGQITPSHSLVGTIFDLDAPAKNNVFGTPTEASTFNDRNVPQELYSLSYSGILSPNLLVEAIYGDKALSFVGSGGPPGDFVNATNVYLPRWGARAGAPTFGTQGGTKERASTNLTLKGTYYASTASLGSHSIVFGYEDFTENTTENNNQSGSDFTVYSYNTPSYDENGNFQIGLSQFNGFIIWWPVLELSQTSDLQTESLFINDKWDVTNRLSLNLGVRYDRNDGKDQSGAQVADDSKIAPRLSAQYDLFGDGRVRLSATYAEYVSKVPGGNVGDNTSAAAAPSIAYWLYGGPTIAPTNTRDMLAQIWEWFQGVGGTDNQDWLLFAETNGVGNQILGSLESPAVTEWTVGGGTQLGSRGFARLDYQNREWNDFYTSLLTLDNPRVIDPLSGGETQITYTTNSDDLTREYQAILLQAGYRLMDRLNVGVHYTYSELEGNVLSETSGSGPISDTGFRYQPELLNYDRRNPVGLLSFDRPHKLDAWISYDQPTPIGNFNFSILQNYGSGAPYGEVGTISLTKTATAADFCEACRDNPGYRFPSQAASYYFTDRDEYRTNSFTRTDLALNYALPIGGVEVFIQGEVFNVFDEDEVLGANTTVYTANDSQCVVNGARCATFDPFTETPVEGVHYIKGANFGQPTSVGSYQDPREWRFSAGFRF